jgi:hypothetical protein
VTKGLDQPTGSDEGEHHHARTRAKAVAEFEGVTKLQALQRVLYRSAKQDPTRRFHAVYDKLARSDVMWQAWVNVATNQGAPGIDGISSRPGDLPADGNGALWVCARRAVNGVGKPCAGEPHARFDRGPLGMLTLTVTKNLHPRGKPLGLSTFTYQPC